MKYNVCVNTDDSIYLVAQFRELIHAKKFYHSLKLDYPSNDVFIHWIEYDTKGRCYAKDNYYRGES